MCAILQVEYVKQLLMENITHLVRFSSADDDCINVGLVVQLLRTSDNQETQKHTLLLLACIAKCVCVCGYALHPLTNSHP